MTDDEQEAVREYGRETYTDTPAAYREIINAGLDALSVEVGDDAE
jgi:hypothetical protein